MRIKVIDTGRVENLEYRSWNGVRYGQDEAAEIVSQCLNPPYDRANQAHVMSAKDLKFWRQYLKHLEADEASIRDAYQKYRSSDVEKELKLALKIAGDDPSKHHKARRSALKILKENYEARPQQSTRMSAYDRFTSVRLSASTDADLIDLMDDLAAKKLPKNVEIKRLIRLGLKYEKEIAAQREADIQTLRGKGWL